MRLKSKDYERLTLITSLRKKRKSGSFTIDYPAGFENAAEENEVWHLDFEFTGPDNIKYLFKTTGGEFSRGKIRVNFPEKIERYQRRGDFRLDAPAGTRLRFTLNSETYELLVKNISLGGALGALGNLNPKLEQDLIQTNSQVIENAELIFTDKHKRKISIPIRQAKIKRLARNSVSNNYEYALQFTHLEDESELRLTDIIYHFQRDYLRKRKMMKA